MPTNPKRVKQKRNDIESEVDVLEFSMIDLQQTRQSEQKRKKEESILGRVKSLLLHFEKENYKLTEKEKVYLKVLQGIKQQVEQMRKENLLLRKQASTNDELHDFYNEYEGNTAKNDKNFVKQVEKENKTLEQKLMDEFAANINDNKKKTRS
jgi:hypothetical protein